MASLAIRRKWKEIVDDWVRLHNTGGGGDGGSSIIGVSLRSTRVLRFLWLGIFFGDKFLLRLVPDNPDEWNPSFQWWQLTATPQIKSKAGATKALG
jgi:hypothetical protein